MKKLISTLLILSMLVGSSSTFAGTNLKPAQQYKIYTDYFKIEKLNCVVTDGVEKAFKDVKFKNKKMFGTEAFFKLGKMDVRKVDNTTYIKFADKELAITNSIYARLNGKTVTLPAAPFMDKNMLYIPTDAVKLLGYEIYWSKYTKNVYLETPKDIKAEFKKMVEERKKDVDPNDPMIYSWTYYKNFEFRENDRLFVNQPGSEITSRYIDEFSPTAETDFMKMVLVASTCNLRKGYTKNFIARPAYKSIDFVNYKSNGFDVLPDGQSLYEVTYDGYDFLNHKQGKMVGFLRNLDWGFPNTKTVIKYPFTILYSSYHERTLITYMKIVFKDEWKLVYDKMIEIDFLNYTEHFPVKNPMYGFEKSFYVGSYEILFSKSDNDFEYSFYRK